MPLSGLSWRGSFAAWLAIAWIGSVGCQPDGNMKSDASAPPNPSSDDWENPASVAIEPLAHHPRLELSNLRFSKALDGSESFSVDWRLTSGQPFPGTVLVIKQPGHPTMEMAHLMRASETSGTIKGKIMSFGASPPLESGCEVYLAALEGQARFKISNSITSGRVPTTSTRKATAEERSGSVVQTAEEPPDLLALPAETGLSQVPADLPLPAGTPLRALYAQQWQPVTVLTDLPDGKVKIHWDGYGDNWDEAKPRGDLRIETAVLEQLRKGQPARNTRAASDAALDPQQLTPGQKLQAEWAGKWLPVTVKKVLPDGQVEVHWDGYSDNFDEALPVARLRNAN